MAFDRKKMTHHLNILDTTPKEISRQQRPGRGAEGPEL